MVWGMLRPSWGVAVICNGFLCLRTTSNPPGPTGPGRQYSPNRIISVGRYPSVCTGMYRCQSASTHRYVPVCVGANLTNKAALARNSSGFLCRYEQ
ncbi:hypothetical protein PF005_g12645 [Phytophthora fragariae]|uniref:Secreted protein n=1 Tax=Phytophthora fragariae TaxID=53985 RepID=A0A6A3JQK5_9STRA|nr:hypothetical protein PF003_g31200 [Phytophthora fragariae]KAE8934872.1 hypothetical protein PF009_g15156 [Phytophthora fragariae]KAE8997450.1 hypothetical protein PF011_g15486 [Phytophthora fragariae]KAE9094155.1 hypothetical protein PF007_g17863 [Phytophthora fragariae]KAE9094853.1 hypothetical protein PF010_g16936 [Phytophthora fragariae]